MVYKLHVSIKKVTLEIFQHMKLNQYLKPTHQLIIVI